MRPPFPREQATAEAELHAGTVREVRRHASINAVGWAAVCGAAHPSGVVCPRKLLGHLRYHIQLKRPQELWVMMCEVLFGRR